MIFDTLNQPDNEIESKIRNIFTILHQAGPVNPELLEECALIKYFRPELFKQYEPQLMYLLGLFYKTETPQNLISFSYTLFENTILEESKNKLTPVQWCIYKDIKENKIYSFSAPTSAGKSFLLRQLISEITNDVIIVVPSRALVAEYIYVLRETFEDNNSILILPFVEDINVKKTKRRVFVLTPERVSELFKNEYSFDIGMFVFDEAQMADDKQRGINFANIVNKSAEKYPNAKKIFAHPFIINPEIQLSKLGLSGKNKTFPQNTVGKIFISHKNEKNYLFNPYINGAYLLKNQISFDDDILKNFIKENKTVLFFVSKKEITEKRIFTNFSEYITLCDEIKNEDATKIIDRIQDLLDAKEERNSMLINLLKRGIVIHHGSIPLDVRFLLERFTSLGFAKICFSTSTLLQGINMPFDAIYIDNFRFYGDQDEKSLGLKNLIGRAGRTTQIKNNFDYGFVIVNNDKTFSERIRSESKLNEKSVLDQNVPEDDIFLKETIESVKENKIDTETNEPEPRLKRLQSDECKNFIEILLNILFENGIMKDYGSFLDDEKHTVRILFQKIFELYIDRPLLSGEKYIFSSGLTIFLWQMQGNSFKKILNLRYNYLAHGQLIRNIYKRFESGEIDQGEKNNLLSNVKLDFSPIPGHLPDRTKIKCPPSYFVGKSLLEFDYDSLVYDTYDYVDKVVELSLKGPFITAFKVYFDITHDERAKKMINYTRYGTIDEKIILLKKYGFSEEQIENIQELLISVSKEEIVFDETQLDKISDPVLLDLIHRYL